MTYEEACKLAHKNMVAPSRIMRDTLTGKHHIVSETAVPFWEKHGYKTVALVRRVVTIERTINH